jgi:predicted Ser/Thr protein kinase
MLSLPQTSMRQPFTPFIIWITHHSLEDQHTGQMQTLTRSYSRSMMIPSSQIKYGDHVLGSGAQGVVYRAEWNHRPVVLKLLHIRQDTAEKLEFLQELDVWRCVLKSRVLDISDINHRNIQHPNSIALYGAVDDSGKIGYVMEYCHNGSLYQNCERERDI